MEATHEWKPQWGLWQRITTALLAFEESMDDDTDLLLRMEIIDLNRIMPNLRDPAAPRDSPSPGDTK